MGCYDEFDNRKDPDEVKDWRFDWRSAEPPGPRLEPTETIVTSEFIVPPDLTIDPRSTNDSTTATIWLAGGIAGQDYEIVNRVLTSAGRLYEDGFTLQVRDLPT